jgi:hypothetical protein
VISPPAKTSDHIERGTDVGLLAKPFTIEQLMIKVRQALAQ